MSPRVGNYLRVTVALAASAASGPAPTLAQQQPPAEATRKPPKPKKQKASKPPKPEKQQAPKSPKPPKTKKEEKPKYPQVDWYDVAAEGADRPGLLARIREDYRRLGGKDVKGADLRRRSAFRAKLGDARWLLLMEKPSLTAVEREELRARDDEYNMESIEKLDKAPVGKDLDKLKAARKTLQDLFPSPPPEKADEKKGGPAKSGGSGQ
jgi:hypothetical protein